MKTNRKCRSTAAQSLGGFCTAKPVPGHQEDRLSVLFPQLGKSSKNLRATLLSFVDFSGPRRVEQRILFGSHLESMLSTLTALLVR